MALKPLSLGKDSTSTLRIGGSALLTLTGTTKASSVVGVTVGAPFLSKQL